MVVRSLFTFMISPRWNESFASFIRAVFVKRRVDVCPSHRHRRQRATTCQRRGVSALAALIWSRQSHCHALFTPAVRRQGVINFSPLPPPRPPRDKFHCRIVFGAKCGATACQLSERGAAREIVEGTSSRQWLLSNVDQNCFNQGSHVWGAKEERTASLKPAPSGLNNSKAR